jgi:hypothetical protein
MLVARRPRVRLLAWSAGLGCHLVAIRPYRESDRPWAESLLDEFGGPLQARRGELIDVLALPGFTAERDGRPVGLLTYGRANGECELAFIAALERHGIGSPGAVDETRERLKPQISTVGDFGIPIRDEIELELRPIDPSSGRD